MANEDEASLEGIERSQQELRELMMRNQEENWE